MQSKWTHHAGNMAEGTKMATEPQLFFATPWGDQGPSGSAPDSQTYNRSPSPETTPLPPVFNQALSIPEVLGSGQFQGYKHWAQLLPLSRHPILPIRDIGSSAQGTFLDQPSVTTPEGSSGKSMGCWGSNNVLCKGGTLSVGLWLWPWCPSFHL